MAYLAGGYRGELDIDWTLEGSTRGSVTLFGTSCPHCFMAWGWLPDLTRVRKLRRGMEKLGCPACSEKGVERPKKPLGPKAVKRVVARWLHPQNFQR